MELPNPKFDPKKKKEFEERLAKRRIFPMYSQNFRKGA